MWEMLLETSGQTQHFRGVFAVEGDDVCHLRRGQRQCAGLIEDDGVRLRDGFEEFSALDGDVIFRSLANGAEHSERHGKLERTAEIHHQHRECARRCARQRQRCQTAGKRVWHEFVSQARRFGLAAALQALAFFDHGDDLVVAALPGGFFDENETFAFFDNGAGVDNAVHMLRHRDRFASQRSLVDGGFSFDDDAIQRDHTASADDDPVARLHTTHRHQHVCAIFVTQPDTIHIQRHGARQVGDGFFACPVLEQFADLKQEDDRACRAKIAAAGRNANGDRIQQLDLELALTQTAETAPEKWHHVTDKTHHAQWCRQKKAAADAGEHLADELFLERAVDGAG